MAQRPQGSQSKIMAADGYVSGDGATEAHNVYALVITATGATAGDKVAIRDGGPTGAVKAYFELPATAGIWNITFGRYGIFCALNVFYSENVVAAGKVRTTVVFG